MASLMAAIVGTKVGVADGLDDGIGEKRWECCGLLVGRYVGLLVRSVLSINGGRRLGTADGTTAGCDIDVWEGYTAFLKASMLALMLVAILALMMVVILTLGLDDS